jgi:GAF domain-containing protein
LKPKRHGVLKAVSQGSSPPGETEVTRLTRERDEALEQPAATADVLKVVSRSKFDLQMVLNTLVESAARLCDSNRAWIVRRDGELYRLAASYGYSKEEDDQVSQYMPAYVESPGRGSVVARTILEGQPVQIEDVLADPEYTLLDLQRIANYRTALGIPLLREGVPIGVLAMTRSEQLPFSHKQIALLTTFADQAVIAIENTRLLSELRESLQQQTANADVLKVISNSPGDLEPVFATMLEKAVRICDAKFGNIYRWDGDVGHLVATHNTPTALAEARRRSPVRPSPGNATGRMLATKVAVQVADLAAEEGYTERRNPDYVTAVELGGIRTVLAVPMLKENELIGWFTIYRQEVRPFSDKQIELAQNFAAQAVIAIENTRLLNELRQRTADLTESLEQQTATSEQQFARRSAAGVFRRA